MIKRLISKAEFSRQAGVSRMAVTKACAGALKAAVDGKSISIDHPDAVAYIESKRAKKTPTAAKKPRKAAATPKKKPVKTVAAPEPPEPTDSKSHFSEDDEIEEVLHLTLRQIVKKFGTSGQFQKWVKAYETIVDVQTKSVKLAALEKSLVHRVLIKTHIFGAIENANLKLLRDSSKTITRKLFALVKAGGSLDDGEILVRKLISDQLKNVSSTAKRILKNA